MKSLEDIIQEWEEKEFGHYECDCVPATKEQIKRLANNLRKENKYVEIDGTIYIVLEQIDDEVCVLQTFDYADGFKRQLKIWTKLWKPVKSEVYNYMRE